MKCQRSVVYMGKFSQNKIPPPQKKNPAKNDPTNLVLNIESVKMLEIWWFPICSESCTVEIVKMNHPVLTI